VSQPKRPIKSLADLINLATVQRFLWKGRMVWWRGEPATFDTALVPAMLRGARGVRDETNMLSVFRLQAVSRSRDLPDQRDLIAWLFLMQHQGLPTRLLDWTENALVAAFHAIASNPDEAALIWALSPTALNAAAGQNDRILLGNHREVQRILNVAFNGKGDSDKVLALQPPESDLRALLQSGRCTIHGATDRQSGEANTDGRQLGANQALGSRGNFIESLTPIPRRLR